MKSLFKYISKGIISISLLITIPLLIGLGYILFSSAFFSMNKDVSKEDLDFKFSLKEKSKTDKLPNILLINADDLGYGDLGCYGGNAIRTPNIDRIAANGMRFTNHYTSNAICSPSRAGLLTGRYPIRMGFTSVLYPEDWTYHMKVVNKIGKVLNDVGAADHGKECYVNGLPHKEITLAEALKQKGYATCLSGKWHLGDMKFRKEFNPKYHGFDKFFGVNSTNDLLPVVLIDDEKVIRSNIRENQEDFSQLFAHNAIQFIEQNKDKPFFCYMAFTAPHEPLVPSKEFRGKSKAGLFGDVVEEMDHYIGQILENLEKNGLDENTIILFTSDNGPWYEGSTGGLRGGKGQAFEGGFKVPLLVSWKNKILPNSVAKARVSNLDIFPTLLDIVGLDLPNDRIIDGKNISDILFGKTDQTPHEKIIFYQYEKPIALIMNDHKYYTNYHSYTWPVPLNKNGTFTYTLTKKHMGKNTRYLFNLNTDADENYNIIHHQANRSNDMQKALDEWDINLKNNTGGWK